MKTKFEKIAPRTGGTAEYMLLKETLEKATAGSLSASLEATVEALLEELRLARGQKDKELQQMKDIFLAIPKDTVDIEAIITKVGELHTAAPIDLTGIIEKIGELGERGETAPTSYSFEIERSHSGLLTGITAKPIGKTGGNSAF